MLLAKNDPWDKSRKESLFDAPCSHLPNIHLAAQLQPQVPRLVRDTGGCNACSEADHILGCKRQLSGDVSGDIIGMIIAKE